MSKKILLIDDEELIIKTLTKLLEKNDYEVFVVKRGEDALIAAEEDDFDLIISDIRMPGMTGVESIKSIQKICLAKGAKSPPIIFITGFADKTTEKEARSLNPTAFIYKPFDIQELVKTVQDNI